MNLPNKLTVFRIFLVPIFMIFIIPIPHWVINSSLMVSIRPQLETINQFIVNYGNYAAALIFIIAASTDKLDGYIARKKNLITKFGIFLDPIADKLLVTAALISLVQRNQVDVWAATIIIARELIVTGLRLAAAGEKVILPAGIWGKVKMVTQTVAVSLALLRNFPFSLITDIRFDSYAMLIAVAITIYSGCEYIIKNRRIVANA